MSKSKICLVDEHAIFRAGIKQILASMKEKFEYEEVSNYSQLLLRLEHQKPSLIIMNLGITDDRIYLTEQLMTKYPDIKILIFADHANDKILIRLINNGLFGCLLRTAEPQELKLAIEMVLSDQCYFSPLLINRILINRAIPDKNGNKKIINDSFLTERELEIVRLLCKGLDQKEIADKLFISPRTVDTHKANIMSKLEVKNTTGIILQAIKYLIVKTSELK
ncbi:response regulator transcription factor [Paludibacter sp.]|uniref:LuxR C-terminal-related transcriptional regulator n=1 Tax=Paludibacter sp. TaxID=1898105 RepID=UPI001352916D|nr:response regulator transcription factor [Paludibacter sp.]MTK53030.1 response regulator transcription factor [Paludibacter sp.]